MFSHLIFEFFLSKLIIKLGNYSYIGVWIRDVNWVGWGKCRVLPPHPSPSRIFIAILVPWPATNIKLKIISASPLTWIPRLIYPCYICPTTYFIQYIYKYQLNRYKSIFYEKNIKYMSSWLSPHMWHYFN